MQAAQVRDAIHRKLFYFHKSLLPEDEGGDEEEEPAVATGDAATAVCHDNEYTPMTIDTIINGKVNSTSNTL